MRSFIAGNAPNCVFIKKLSPNVNHREKNALSNFYFLTITYFIISIFVLLAYIIKTTKLNIFNLFKLDFQTISAEKRAVETNDSHRKAHLTFKDHIKRKSFSNTTWNTL